jgi:hypothetical protein
MIRALAGAAPAATGTNAPVSPAAGGFCGGPAGGTAGGVCRLADTGNAPVVSSAAARAALFFQIDEERMARELYAKFAELWSRRPFVRISRAEARHEAILRQLAARTGSPVPTEEPGGFASAVVQQRFDELAALEVKSARDALRVAEKSNSRISQI